MLHATDLHPYEIRGINLIEQNLQAMLWMDMGLGKTVITLTAIVNLMDELKVLRTLVVAPVRVCQSVWRQEAQKWAHLKHLRFVQLAATPEGTRIQGLNSTSDIVLINYENLTWLAHYVKVTYLRSGRYPPFDMVVYDEVSRVKNTRIRKGMKGGGAMLSLLPYMRRVVGLTGTPTPKGYKDLFGQYLSLDGGHRLGTSFTAFQKTYFHTTDYMGFKWEINEGAGAVIDGCIKDCTVSMSNEDYLTLPDVVTKDLWVKLPDDMLDQYDAVEKQMLVELKENPDVEIFNAASLVNRCLQFANGAVYYDKEKNWESIHEEKLKVLDSIMEEASGAPVLLAYSFQHDAMRITKRYAGAEWIRSGMPGTNFNHTLGRWKTGEIPLLIGHPQSIAHGIDGLQEGGNILVWFGLPWAHDLYDQTGARLLRQGQTKPVMVYRILCRKTTDEAVLGRLQSDSKVSVSIRKAIEQYARDKSNERFRKIVFQPFQNVCADVQSSRT